MTRPISGNAKLFVIAAILAVALAAGAFFFLKGGADQAAPDATVTEETPTTDEGAQLPPASEEQAAEPSEPVEIDIAAATSTRAIGNADAPIKIIEYASMTCSHCGTFHNQVLPALKEKYIDTGEVYLEFREFPLNDPALKATLTARCLPESQYYEFVNVLFKTQGPRPIGLAF